MVKSSGRRWVLWCPSVFHASYLAVLLPIWPLWPAASPPAHWGWSTSWQRSLADHSHVPHSPLLAQWTPKCWGRPAGRWSWDLIEEKCGGGVLRVLAQEDHLLRFSAVQSSLVCVLIIIMKKKIVDILHIVLIYDNNDQSWASCGRKQKDPLLLWRHFRLKWSVRDFSHRWSRFPGFLNHFMEI